MLEEFSSDRIFSHKVNILAGFYDFIQLNDVGVSNFPHNFELSAESILICLVDDFLFLNYLKHNLFIG